METNSEESVVFQQDDLFSQGFPVLEKFRRQGKFCDVTLKVDSQSFTAHENVLAANIPYFHAMFTEDVDEQKHRSITIQGIEANALEAMIDFAYSGRVTIDMKNAQTLMRGASFLQLNKVREACSDFLKERLHPSEVLGVRTFADTLGCDSLIDASEKYIEKNFHNVSASEEFLMLSQPELLDIVKRDELCVVSEEEVFEAIMRWIRKDPEKRQQNLPQLLSNVRLPLLTPRYLAEHVAAEELIRSSHECRDLLDEARDYHLVSERPLLQRFCNRPRNCISGHIFAVGSFTMSDSISTVEVYDPIVGRWQLAETMTILRSGVAVAVMRNKLYALGGIRYKEECSTVEVFDPQKRIRNHISSMHYKRSGDVGAAALNDRLYVNGGTESGNSVECYLPEKDEWTTVASMTVNRKNAAVVAFGGYIYALGGWDGSTDFDSVERYDPRTGQWQDAMPMLTRRCELGAATLNGKMYVCGGENESGSLQSVEVFDPATNQWNFVAPMNERRKGVGLVANMGKLWAIGGHDGESKLSSVEMYDPNSDSWSFVASMCAHEGTVGVGVIRMT